MAGQVEGSTWGGINVPRRCLGRRWQAATSPTTTCSAEAIPRDSAVSSMHSYYSLQREPHVYGDRTDVVTDSRQESTAWSAGRRWSRSPFSTITAATADTERSDDLKNGNGVDNQTFPKRESQMVSEIVSDSWSGINVSRRSRAVGNLWENSRVSGISYTATDVLADSNGNHVEQEQEIGDQRVTVVSNVEQAIDSSYSGLSSGYETKMTESRSNDSTKAWDGINVPRRSGGFRSSVSPPQQQHQSENVYTAQESGRTVHLGNWGGIGVPRRTWAYDRTHETETETQEYSVDSNTSNWGGINVPKRTSSVSRSYDMSPSPPRKQHKVDTTPEETVPESENTARGWSGINVPRRAGSFDRNYGITSRQHYSETVYVQAEDKPAESSQTWGGINVPRRTSRNSYSSSYSSSPRQQTYTETGEVISEATERSNNWSSVYEPRTTTERDNEMAVNKSESQIDSFEVGGYLSRYSKRTLPSSEGKSRGFSPEKGHFESVHVQEDSSGTWGGINVRRRTGSVESKNYANDEIQRQPHQAGTIETNTDNIETGSTQSWGGINVPRRTSSISTHRYNTSPPRQRLESQMVEETSTNIENWSASNASGSNREVHSACMMSTSPEVYQKEGDSVTSASWGGINVPRRTRSIGRSWSSSTSSIPKSPSTRKEESKNQENGISSTPEGRTEQTSSSSREDNWGGIGVRRRSYRSSYTSSSEKHNQEDSQFVDSNSISTKTDQVSHSSNTENDNGVHTGIQETTESTSWSGINVPRRSTSFRSSYTSSSSSKEPTTETIPPESNILQVQQVDAESSWSHISVPRRSAQSSSSSTSAFKQEIKNTHASPERVSRREETRSRTTKSVKWSNTKSPPRSASEVTPIIRSRSRGREDLQRWSATEVPQTERSRSLMRSRSFTSSSRSRRSVSPRRSRERSTYSPSKVITYKLESSPAEALNWSWTPASPLLSDKHRHDTDQMILTRFLRKLTSRVGPVSMYAEVTEPMEVPGK